METVQAIELIKPLKDRWSPRLFANKPVGEEVLTTLFEAARWAPSSFNMQPWRFIVSNWFEDREAFDRMVQLLTPKNKAWAQHAPILFLTVAEVENERGTNRYAWHDVGLAMGNLLAQATAMGLSVHQMAGFHREQAREELNIPGNFEPVAMAALGYRSELQNEEGILERDPVHRSRKELNEIVYTNQWRNL